MPDEIISKHNSTFPTLFFGTVQYHQSAREVVKEGEHIRIEPKAAEALDLLLENQGNVVTREVLLNSIWGELGSDEALTQAISRLRRLFGEAINIKTIPKTGYQLLTTASTETPVQAKKVTSDAPTNSAKPLIDTPLKGFISGFLLATLIAVFSWLLLVDVQISIEEEYSPDGKVSGSTTIEKCKQENCD